MVLISFPKLEFGSTLRPANCAVSQPWGIQDRFTVLLVKAQPFGPKSRASEMLEHDDVRFRLVVGEGDAAPVRRRHTPCLDGILV